MARRTREDMVLDAVGVEGLRRHLDSVISVAGYVEGHAADVQLFTQMPLMMVMLEVRDYMRARCGRYGCVDDEFN